MPVSGMSGTETVVAVAVAAAVIDVCKSLTSALGALEAGGDGGEVVGTT